MRDREALSPVRRAASRPGSGDAHDAWRHDGDATRKARQAAGAGLLEQALQESGLLASEAGRQTVAEFLAKAAASSGAASLPGGVLGRPPLPSRPPPPQFSSGALMPPAAAPAFQPPYAAQPPLPAQPPWPAQGSSSLSAAPSPRAAPHPPPPAAPMPSLADAIVDALGASLIEEVLRSDVPLIVKGCVRSLVATLMPTKTRAHDGGVYTQLYTTLLVDVIAPEARAVVAESVQAVAEDYVQRRGAERVLEAMVDEVPEFARRHQPWALCDPHDHQPWAPCDHSAR